MTKTTISILLLAATASADLAVIRDGKFTGTFYPTDDPKFRAFHAGQGDQCLWMDERPEIVARTRHGRPVYRTPTTNELARAADPDLDVQAGKSAALKAVENRFLLLCEQLTGSRAKASFGTLDEIVRPMRTNAPSTFAAVSIELLAIDAEAKREGGLNWWDSCVWHEEVAE